MRFGVDLHAIQAPSCRGRGIGRYAKALLRALLAEAPAWEFVFYRRADLALDWDSDLDGRVAEWVTIDPDPAAGPDGTLQRIVQDNPHGLDWLLVPNPLVERRGFAIPGPAAVSGGPRLAAIVYDLIPALFPKYYLPDEALAAGYFRDLDRLKGYDLLLAISEATRRDTQEWLRVPARRIANIRAAAPDFFRPAGPGESDSDLDAHRLRALGIREPFFYYLGNVDWRKNTLGAVDVFSRLPADLRESRQLVLTCQENAWFLDRLRRRIEQHGLGDRVVLTGPASDEAVRTFYRRSELFLFPSLYEGFGLPILEAMQCGAAVVAADNSSQPEVVGDAGILAESGNVDDWAEKVAALIRDPRRLRALRTAALEQAGRFSWKDSARRLRDAVEGAARRESRPSPRTLALVPHPSADEQGFGDPATELFRRLCEAGDPVVFFETARASSLPPCPSHARWYDKRLLGRLRSVLGARRILYLVDSLDSLSPLIDDLREHPGVVAFARDGVEDWSDLMTGSAPTARPTREAEEGLREVLRLAEGVACHSRWLHRRLSALAEDRPARPVALLGPGGASETPSSDGDARGDLDDFYVALLRAS